MSKNVDQPTPDEKRRTKQDARFHLANERTLLAWIRTSIGIMAFGFVVVKFSLFLKQLGYLVGEKELAVPPQRYSSTVGILLVGVGAAILILAYIKYKQTESRLLQDDYQPSSKLAFTITLIVLIASVVLIGYLINSSI